MFQINEKDRTGFRITFANGITVSVVFHEFAYCTARNDDQMLRERRSPDCEIGIFGSDNGWLTRQFVPDANDDVIGWVSPEDLVDLVVKVKNYK